MNQLGRRGDQFGIQEGSIDYGGRRGYLKTRLRTLSMQLH